MPENALATPVGATTMPAAAPDYCSPLVAAIGVLLLSVLTLLVASWLDNAFIVGSEARLLGALETRGPRLARFPPGM